MEGVILLLLLVVSTGKLTPYGESFAKKAFSG
jgi:hypothetical protein